jgi:hypothetical protein
VNQVDVPSSLTISDPQDLAVHVREILRLGVFATDKDGRSITIRTNLPQGASLEQAYNSDLSVQQAVMAVTVPDSVSGQICTVNFLASALGDASGSVELSARRAVSVKILPALQAVMNPNPAVAQSAISSALYNTVLQTLEVTGQVIWSPQSTTAERQSAILDPVTLSDAENVIAGTVTAEVALDGSWSVSIPLSSDSVPNAVDAIFQDRVGTRLVKRKTVTAQDWLNGITQ